MESPNSQRVSPAWTPLPASLLWLIGLIVLIELTLELSDRGLLPVTGLREMAYLTGAFWAPLVRGTALPVFGLQPWTMYLTHALLHGGFLHMAMNMAVLAGLGRFASDRYGGSAILPVFGLGAVAGAAAFGAISTSAAPMVGASGAVFAFLGVWVVVDWRMLRARRLPTGPVVTRVLTLAALNVAFFWGLDGMLAWEAHLGGFLAGLACGVVLEKRRDRRFSRNRGGPSR